MTLDVELALGHDPKTGNGIRILISKAPHILVAGMTGAGKSVLIHDLIGQFIGQRPPAEVSLLLVDPKRCEFSPYKGLPHLLTDPVYDERSIEYSLDWVVKEMMDRFTIMEQKGWRDCAPAPWPRLLIVIDELANLVLKGKEYERPIIEMASMGRAAGVHLLLATQTPRADVLSGLVRANCPTRVALPTLTASDSRIILDAAGAEKLAIPYRLIRLPGQRDLVFAAGRHWRDEDIERVVSRWTWQR